MKELVVTRVFDAPRALVFQAWTDPQHVAQWWGPHGFTIPVCEMDLRPGGAILIHMRAPDGPPFHGAIFPMTGVFVEIDEPNRLEFRSAVPDKDGKSIFEVLHTVTLTEKDGKTTLTMHARVIQETPAAAPMLAGMEEGWKQSLERLSSFLARP